MALYNQGYPVTYQPMIYPSFQAQPYSTPQQTGQNPVSQPATQNGIIWVSGEAGAKAYLVAPNNTVQLWDSESQTIYLKSADASGMPSMKILDYSIRETGKNAGSKPVISAEDGLPVFATKEEMKAVSEQLTALRDRVDSLSKRRRRDEEDE